MLSREICVYYSSSHSTICFRCTRCLKQAAVLIRALLLLGVDIPDHSNKCIINNINPVACAIRGASDSRCRNGLDKLHVVFEVDLHCFAVDSLSIFVNFMVAVACTFTRKPAFVSYMHLIRSPPPYMSSWRDGTWDICVRIPAYADDIWMPTALDFNCLFNLNG